MHPLVRLRPEHDTRIYQIARPEGQEGLPQPTFMRGVSEVRDTDLRSLVRGAIAAQHLEGSPPTKLELPRFQSSLYAQGIVEEATRMITEFVAIRRPIKFTTARIMSRLDVAVDDDFRVGTRFPARFEADVNLEVVAITEYVPTRVTD